MRRLRFLLNLVLCCGLAVWFGLVACGGNNPEPPQGQVRLALTMTMTPTSERMGVGHLPTVTVQQTLLIRGVWSVPSTQTATINIYARPTTVRWLSVRT